VCITYYATFLLKLEIAKKKMYFVNLLLKKCILYTYFQAVMLHKRVS